MAALGSQRRSGSHRGKPPPHGRADGGCAGAFPQRAPDPFARRHGRRRGPWQGPIAAARRRHRHADRGPFDRRHRRRLRTDPAGRSARARDWCGACGVEGRADRHPGIHRRRHGKTRRRTQRHRRRDRPLDPPALLRSRRRIRRAFHRSRRGERAVLHSRRTRAAMRCSISPASSGCGWKMPAS